MDPMHPAHDPSIDASCVWVIDGGPVTPSQPSAPEPTYVVAVDSGAQHALTLGLDVDLVVGDLGSEEVLVLVPIPSRAWLRAALSIFAPALLVAAISCAPSRS